MVLTYTVYSPTSQQVSLGAAMRQNGTNNPFLSDPINDRIVSLSVGNNTVIRYFALPNVSNVSYDFQWGLWSAGFGTQYGLIEQDNALAVSGPTPTPLPVCNYNINPGTGGVIVPGTFQVERSQCTDCTVHIDIPFVYSLYDQQFTVIHAGNNGTVQFPTASGINNGCIPLADLVYTFAPYLEDLDTTSVGDGIFTSVSGTQPNRILNIEWRAHAVVSGAPVHFEVRIYEGQQKFQVIYDQVDTGSTQTSIGIQRDPTYYQVYQCQAGGIAPGTTLTFEYACGLPTQTPTATVATSTPTRTPTGAPTNTSTVSPTPTQPVLQSAALGPNPAFGGDTIVLTYTVWSPNSQVVSLGADMAPAGTGAYQNDAANDAQVAINPGLNTITRLFNLGSRVSGSYDVRWGLFSQGFGTQYGLITQSNALTILQATVTPAPTRTPTITLTPTLTPTSNVPTSTPSVTVLQAVALGPNPAFGGQTLVLTYTVWSPTNQLVSLGADMAPAGTGAYQNDPVNDLDIQVHPGLNNVTRLFNLGARSAGNYDVRWGLFQAHFGFQYGLEVRSNALTILAATVTPTGPTNTPTATPTGPTSTSTPTITGTPPTATNTPLVSNTPTPSAPMLSSASVSPASVPRGGTVTLNFTIFSPSAATYALGADISNNGNQYTDPGNDRLVSVPAGVSNVSRNFYIRPDDSTGVYNVSFGLWNTAFSIQYGSQVKTNALTITAATPTPSVGIPHIHSHQRAHSQPSRRNPRSHPALQHQRERGRHDQPELQGDQ